ncbi:ABC transporter substrate-binding protein [Paraglaciecola arctica]|uniref:ABC transporter substrate-binding protein n=1 Tax=Paraglaciecola arctica TaxID=1128911 RepID=UPI001C06504F|nr:ABC transporter substrate-binding protein [Paraglaciecola arctica]MBU3004852.1 ABC transporter substrate-binding protein [Paraglaciecola arctica]
MISALILCLATVLLNISTIHAKPVQLSVAVLAINKQQISLFAEQFYRFNNLQSEVVIDVDFYSDQGLKSKLLGWLETGKYDLIHWQAGRRLDDLVVQELLLPIDRLIDKKTLNKNVSSQLLDSVEYSGSYLALPFAYYPWGFYYSKTVFAKHGILPPKSWAEFLAICDKLKKLGIAPLVQANQEGWPLLGWIDFLALDNGGIETRQEMTEFASVGRDSIARVVEQFSILLDYGYFFAPDHSWRWEQAITLLLRQQAAMSLIGQFAESEIQPEHNSQIGYFPFPHSQSNLVYPEVAPIDLFMVPLASNNHEHLPILLNFLAQPETNKALASGIGFLPVYPEYDGEGLSERALIGLRSLQKSTELVPFFDRDSEEKYATNLANSIAHSILNGEASAFEGALSGHDFVNSTNQTLDYVLPEKLLNFTSFTGSRGTFFVSNVLSEVYKKLGYNLSVTRYRNLPDSLNSYKYGADGELVRAAVFNGLSEDLIQVPEPLAESSIYLLCHTKVACTGELSPQVEVGTSIEILSIEDWWKTEKAIKQDYTTTSLMLQAFMTGQLNYMILTAADMAAYSEQLSNSSFRTILTIPFYHFIHEKHRTMLRDVNQGIKDFKQTSAYQDFKKRYWLN